MLYGLQESDLEKIQEWLNDDDVTKLLFQGLKPSNLQVMKEDFNKNIRNAKEIVFLIVDKKSNKKVGWTGIYEIDWISKKGELRFFIGDKKFWGKGFATDAVSLLIDYAFKKLNLHRVYGGANKENKASIRIFKKLSFSEEGITKDGYFRNGRYYDLIHFGLINKSKK